ncbi:arginase family protein [Moraxella sp. Pampa]|uniref:arginase family protein n=1 Tax=Moraxella sp. Pampa TaxID=3111978 RepID=UPI002B4150B3|nr:arginase family protein [Moraxella sp. Pampa]
MLDFIEIRSDLGAGKHGTDQGVVALAKFAKSHYPTARFEQLSIDDANTAKVQGTQYTNLKYAEFLLPFYQEVADHIEHIAKLTTPIIISGDHSGAIGLLSGFKNAHKDKKVAVVWIDAHADIHSVYTTPSGNMHGMPLAAVLGVDNDEHTNNMPTDDEKQLWQAFKDLSTSDNLNIKDLYFLGLRSFESPEQHLIEKHGVFAYSAHAHRQEFDDVLDKLCSNLAQADAVYVSFDIDSLDENLVYATGTREPNGYGVDEIKQIFDKVLVLPNIKAFEITEFNPTLDDDTNRHQMIYDLFAHAINHLK